MPSSFRSRDPSERIRVPRETAAYNYYTYTRFLRPPPPIHTLQTHTLTIQIFVGGGLAYPEYTYGESPYVSSRQSLSYKTFDGKTRVIESIVFRVIRNFPTIYSTTVHRYITRWYITQYDVQQYPFFVMFRIEHS